jgi:hypothetical protein
LINSDDYPKSPILEIRRRTSPVLRRNKRAAEKNSDFKTPEKQSPNVSLASSPIISAKRRRGQFTRGKAHIVEIESQKQVDKDCDIITVSPVKTPEPSQSSYINPINSPIIKIQKPRVCIRGVTAGRNTIKVVCSRENFEIVDDSQESRGAVQSIECASSQDAGNVASKTFTDKVHWNELCCPGIKLTDQIPDSKRFIGVGRWSSKHGILQCG